MSNDSERYSVSIILSSEDFPSKAVEVDYAFSHSMVDRVLEGKDVPASYALGQAIASMLAQERYPQTFNYTDEELNAMTEEQQEVAIREAAAQAVNTVVVPRITRE